MNISHLGIILTVIIGLITIISSFKTQQKSKEHFKDGETTNEFIQQATMLNRNIAHLTDTVKNMPPQKTVYTDAGTTVWDRYADLQSRMNQIEISKNDSFKDLYGNQLETSMKVDSLQKQFEHLHNNINNSSLSSNVMQMNSSVDVVNKQVQKLTSDIIDISSNISNFDKWKDIINNAENMNMALRKNFSKSSNERFVIQPNETGGFLAIDASIPNKTYMLRSKENHEFYIGQADNPSSNANMSVDLMIDGKPSDYHSIAFGSLAETSSGIIGTRNGAKNEELLLAKIGKEGPIRHFAQQHIFDIGTSKIGLTDNTYASSGVMKSTELNANKKTMMIVDNEGVHLNRHTIKSTDDGELVVCDRKAPTNCKSIFSIS
jgi:hypothetical protein